MHYRLNERTQLGPAHTSKVELEFKDGLQVDDIRMIGTAWWLQFWGS